MGHADHPGTCRTHRAQCSTWAGGGSFLAFFEEVGWRAWLVPRLVNRIGARHALVVTAIIWALWHVPFELSGILHIDGVSPVKLALTIPFGTTATGLILGWLWLRTESIWLVAIAHGALNNWGQYAFKYMNESATPDADLLVLSAGSLGLLVIGAFLLCGANVGGTRRRAPDAQ